MNTTTEAPVRGLSAATFKALAGEYLDPSGHGNHEPLNGWNLNGWQELQEHLLEKVSVVWDRNDIGHVRLVSSRVLWIPVENSEPYSGLEDMSEAFSSHLAQVSDLYHDHPVFNRADNLRFRVWHDEAHIRNGLGFSIAHELRLWAVQARELIEADRPLAAEALFCETVYQAAAAVHLGAYPDVQHCVGLGPVGRAVFDALLLYQF